MHNIYNPFCPIKIKNTTFDRSGFMFVQRCVAVKDASVKERHFPDNLIFNNCTLVLCRNIKFLLSDECNRASTINEINAAWLGIRLLCFGNDEG